jgi:hypothetical protein
VRRRKIDVRNNGRLEERESHGRSKGRNTYFGEQEESSRLRSSDK